MTTAAATRGPKSGPIPHPNRLGAGSVLASLPLTVMGLTS
jgi:hypothetical protein